MPRALWEFTRPHTVIGTTCAVWVLYVLAAADAHRQSLPTALTVYVASLALNIYIVGLNQLTDVDIDRINKPYLPLAAGTLTPFAATAIVAVAGAIALLAAAAQGRYLFGTIGVIFLIGSMYSLPPFRLKRSPFLAAAAITLARAVVGNVGVYLTYSAALAGAATLPSRVVLFVGFMTCFMVVISLMKDIPDLEGDRAHRIPTVVARLGARRTLLVCHLILTFCYTWATVAVFWPVAGVHRGVIVVSHAVALIALWSLAARVDVDDNKAIAAHYMFVWKLFYLEFAIFPAACLLA